MIDATPAINSLRALASSRGFDLTLRDEEFGLMSRMTGLPEPNDERQDTLFSAQEAREFLVQLSADGNPKLPDMTRYPNE